MPVPWMLWKIVVKRKRLEKLPWTSRLAIEMMSTGKMGMCMYMCALKYVYEYCKKQI